MKINDTLHGFVVKNIRHFDELGADVVEMVYEKNGAKLVWLDRDDDNMTFAITFKTVPHDDTGVFHILEHSVLCGSDKFPTKEPFVDLLKSSLQTFLNALTFPDKTMYPVSSRNRRDFLNLTDVYMDAVLHPMLYKREDIFRQEGWHYEIDDAGKLSRNGVVYSEMKGAFADVDRQLYCHLSSLLFPDNCYGYVSGGAPEAIPTLTYEQFKENHRTFYHPSNAYIVLDGNVPLDDTLALLDGYLCAYEPLGREIHIGERKPVKVHEMKGTYEVAPDAPTENKAQYAEGYVYGRFDDPKTLISLNILADVLASTNEDILPRAILAEGLADSVEMQGGEDEIKYGMPMLFVKNTDESKLPRLKEVIRTTLEKAADEGLNKDRLTAALNSLEFSLRERDFGGMPKGIVFGWKVMSSWLYGGDPVLYLAFGDLFDQLRKDMNTGYFEDVLRKCFINNPDKASVFLVPSTTLGAEKQAALDKELAEKAAAMSDAEKETVRKNAEALLLGQRTPDSPENLAKLPKLPVSEVDDTPRDLPLDVSTVAGRPLMTSNADTSGILYASLYFNVSDLDEEELSAASFLSGLLGDLSTADHDAIDLQTQIGTHLGAFGCALETFNGTNILTDAATYAVVSASLLGCNEDKAVALIEEILNRTNFNDERRLMQTVMRRKLELHDRILNAGTQYASMRINAFSTTRGLCNECTSGVAFYRWLCDAEKQLKKDAGSFCAKIGALATRIFTRDRLGVGITGKASSTFAERLTNTVPAGSGTFEPRALKPWGKRCEAILIPADISFSAYGTNLGLSRIPYRGSMSVAALSLSYNYLWNVIRVQNGAYGAGARVDISGFTSFYTYRDPNVATSLECMKKAGEFLEKNPPEQKALDSLIIATVGDLDPLLSPRLQGKVAMSRYFNHVTLDRKTKELREVLATTPDDLARFGKDLTAMNDTCSTCVIGGKAAVDNCGKIFDSVESLD